VVVIWQHPTFGLPLLQKYNTIILYTPTPSQNIFYLADPPPEIQSKKIPTYRERIGFTGGDPRTIALLALVLHY
jgi:hypothetical protein